jgi:hypothetical protein
MLYSGYSTPGASEYAAYCLIAGLARVAYLGLVK